MREISEPLVVDLVKTEMRHGNSLPLVHCLAEEGKYFLPPLPALASGVKRTWPNVICL